MMDKMKILNDLRETAIMYEKKVTQQMLMGYVANLEDLDSDLIHEALKILIKKSKWFPKVAEIREQVRMLSRNRAEKKQKLLPDAPDIPDADREFMSVAMPFIDMANNGIISFGECWAKGRAEARKAGVEHKINWDDFPTADQTEATQDESDPFLYPSQ